MPETIDKTAAESTPSLGSEARCENCDIVAPLSDSNLCDKCDAMLMLDNAESAVDRAFGPTPAPTLRSLLTAARDSLYPALEILRRFREQAEAEVRYNDEADAAEIVNQLVDTLNYLELRLTFHDLPGEEKPQNKD